MFFSTQIIHAEILSMKAQKCLYDAELNEQEGNRFSNDERDPTYWFDNAMKNYLCAAKEGSSIAKWHAVNLSGSGQVKALNKDIENRLLQEAAHDGVEGAQIAIAINHCDNVGTNEPCKNPIEAILWLNKASKNGSPFAPYHLGILYERSKDLNDIDKLDRAYACFQLSLNRIHDAMKNNFNLKDIMDFKYAIDIPESGIFRIKEKTGSNLKEINCY